MNTQQLFFCLQALGERHERGMLQSFDEKGLKEILKLRSVLRHKVTVVHMDVFLEIAAHQAVLISHSVWIDAVRGQQKARGFNSAATYHVKTRLGFSIFPVKSLELDALDCLRVLTRCNCRNIRVQKDGNIRSIFELLSIRLSEIGFRAPARTIHVELILVEGRRVNPEQGTEILEGNASADLKDTFRTLVAGIERFAGNRPSAAWNPASHLEVKIIETESLPAPERRCPPKDSSAPIMNAGVRQSDDLTLKQFLGIRLGLETASFQKQDLLARSQEFPCDRYACRPRADNTDIRREGSPILKC